MFASENVMLTFQLSSVELPASYMQFTSVIECHATYEPPQLYTLTAIALTRC
jgi:hypothetical protein